MSGWTYRFAALALLCPVAFPLAAQTVPPTRVGPPAGTVIVVGGGRLGAEIYDAFIRAAGGPDALIVDIPTAGGDTTYGQDWTGARAWRAHGARNVVVLHTTSRAVANSDSFPKILARAGGVWFDGGRQYRLVDAYLDTRTEAAFYNVLQRGGVVGGTSAGATILGEFLVRGAPSNDNRIVDDPRYERGFAFLRGVAIDQHVVARERLADLADSIMPRYPSLFPMSADEGTAWVVHGDTATIIGAGAAFAYGAQAHDPGKPFLTLHPGDVFDLAGRRLVRGAADGAPITTAFLDSLFRPYARGEHGGATVLVADGGKVLADLSYGVEPEPNYMPTTTVPLFDVGGIAAAFHSLCDQLPPPPPMTAAAESAFAARARRPPTEPTGEPERRPGMQGGMPGRGAAGAGGRGEREGFRGPMRATPFERCFDQTIAPPVGLHHTFASGDGGIGSNVDELYRFALGLDRPGTAWGRAIVGDSTVITQTVDPASRWRVDSVGGAVRYSVFGLPDGGGAALMRVPERRVYVIVLTRDADAKAKDIADRIVRRLLGLPEPARRSR